MDISNSFMRTPNLMPRWMAIRLCVVSRSHILLFGVMLNAFCCDTVLFWMGIKEGQKWCYICECLCNYKPNVRWEKQKPSKYDYTNTLYRTETGEHSSTEIWHHRLLLYAEYSDFSVTALPFTLKPRMKEISYFTHRFSICDLMVGSWFNCRPRTTAVTNMSLYCWNLHSHTRINW
jgi:hypothetical protein